MKYALYTILLNREKKQEIDDNSIDNSDEQTKLRRLESLKVLLLQTDGGPDHNLSFLRTKLALVALFIAIDVDHFVALRGAPHGSYLNTVERCMSLLNLGLQNLALKRGKMALWAEEEVANIQSMASVRKYYEELKRDEFALEKSRRIHIYLLTHFRYIHSATATKNKQQLLVSCKDSNVASSEGKKCIEIDHSK